VCKINLLIIGNSLQQNKNIIKTVQNESHSLAGDIVRFEVKIIDPFGEMEINLNDYNLAVIDQNFIDQSCAKSILGSGIPILSWNSGLQQEFSGETVSSVIRSVVEKSLLCEHIIKTTKEIDVTHKIISNSSDICAFSNTPSNVVNSFG